MATSPHTIGLDLGQTSDFTATAVLERQEPAPPPQEPGAALKPQETTKPLPPVFLLRYLRRWPLGTSYTTIADDVAKIVASPAMVQPTLVVDQTGVGRPVVDMLRKVVVGGKMVPVTITGGHSAHREAGGNGWSVPKKILVACMQVLLQTRRIQFAKGLPDCAVLIKELQEFRVKITAAANETFGNWRDGQHDDLVLAVALAAWHADRRRISWQDTIAFNKSIREG